MRFLLIRAGTSVRNGRVYSIPDWRHPHFGDDVPKLDVTRRSNCDCLDWRYCLDDTKITKKEAACDSGFSDPATQSCLA
jgi:hypothetical protein